LKAKILGYTLQDGQLRIIGSVLDPECKRLIVSAYTQYGKTRAVAIGVLLRILKPAKKKIIFIGPTIDQTNIIRTYVAELISADPRLSALVDTPKRRAEDLKKEMSRKRLTLKTGWEIVTLTAHGAGEEPGKQLMGHGGDIIIIDEACLIDDEVYRKRISRMWGSKADAEVIILVNPWHRRNFAFRAWRNPKYRKIHIPWQQGVREGRVTREYIEEQRRELTSYEFKVLYDSDFAEDAEDTLIRWEWIEQAVKHKQTLGASVMRVNGLDVAEKGRDLTILQPAVTDGSRYILGQPVIIDRDETIPIAIEAGSKVPKGQLINVDSIGVGSGVWSYLKQIGHRANSVRVSEKSTLDPDRFANLKAQRFWILRRLFEERMIQIPDHPELKRQLNAMRYELDALGKIRIVDPTDKSPDYASAAMLCIFDGQRPPQVRHA
jgi:hypothetical protein